MDDDVCPICLDPFTDDCPPLQMPVCCHQVHVRCALSAAQYDVRCPICRTRDPTIIDKHEEETHRAFPPTVAATTLELADLYQQHERMQRRYRQRRCATIRRHESLKRLRDRLKVENRMFTSKEKELERTWNRFQRHQWMHNEDIKKIKSERNRMQRRVHDMQKRLDRRIEDLIGEEPPSLFDIRFEIAGDDASSDSDD